MDCRQARDWLLQADDPLHGPPEATSHLAGCADCRLLANDLVRLEANWRAIPAPATVEVSRERFLDRLARPRTLPAPERRLAGSPRRWAVAALLLIGLGAASWFLFPTPQAAAAPAVIDQLIDWNLDLAEAPTPADRSRLFARQDSLKAAVVRTRLSPADQELAHMLLDNGAFLSENDDPVAEAERLSSVADHLVERLQTAADKKDQPTLKRLVHMQQRVALRGVNPKLAQAQQAGAKNPAAKARVDKILKRDEKRVETLADLLDKNPDMPREELLDVIKQQRKKPKQ